MILSLCSMKIKGLNFPYGDVKTEIDRDTF